MYIYFLQQSNSERNREKKAKKRKNQRKNTAAKSCYLFDRLRQTMEERKEVCSKTKETKKGFLGE